MSDGRLLHCQHIENRRVVRSNHSQSRHDIHPSRRDTLIFPILEYVCINSTTWMFVVRYWELRSIGREGRRQWKGSVRERSVYGRLCWHRWIQSTCCKGRKLCCSSSRRGLIGVLVGWLPWWWWWWWWCWWVMMSVKRKRDLKKGRTIITLELDSRFKNQKMCWWWWRSFGLPIASIHCFLERSVDCPNSAVLQTSAATMK